MKQVCLVIFMYAIMSACMLWAAEAPYNAMGEKAGEVNRHSAILQTRLTAAPQREADGEVPGAEGWVCFELSAYDNFSHSRFGSWHRAKAENDYIVKEQIGGLASGTRYFYRVHLGTVPGRSERVGPRRTFSTAPEIGCLKDVNFAVVTSHRYKNLDHQEGFNSYVALGRIKPDFIVLTGDDVYYDNDAPPVAVDLVTCRLHWHRMYSLPRLVSFFGMVPSFWEKDDHDYRFDDADPYMPAREGGSPDDELGRRIFLEQAPVPEKTYRTVHWGKAVQLWLPEGRDFRSPNDMPDGPGKSVWGVEQRRWLEKSICESTALFKILLSPSPLLGPDRDDKKDNHANRRGFFTEGRNFLRKLQQSGVDNFYIVCGDRHWKYHSLHPETGYEEFCSGALTDGASVEKPDYSEPTVERKWYLGNGGFLIVRTEVEGEGIPELFFDFYEDDGSLAHTVRREFVGR
jgi:alkaline phosphatase D